MNINYCQANNSNRYPYGIAIPWFQEAMTRHLYAVPVTDEALRTLVEKTASQGEYDVAIALLDELILRHPDSAIDYNNRGLMHFRQQNYGEAIADYTQAISLNPRLDSAYNNRGNCYAAQGKFAEAMADYEIALDFNPANLRTWINQGITFRELGLYDLAIENFDLALVLGRRLKGRIYGERGRTYHLRGDWNCAIADYQRALNELPDTPNSRRYQEQVKNWSTELLNPLSA
ncbi:MAG: tetratricopeptide repeat protein [Chroococcales cyanobacterium]